MTHPKAQKRLDPSLFDLPVEKIKAGWFSDKYFARTRETLLKDQNHARVLMQVFCRKAGIVCGTDEAIAILQLCSDRPEELNIRSLHDGDAMGLEETVMLIEGDYSTFAHLETLYLGCLARQSAVATAVRKVVEAVRGKPVLFFAARFDDHRVQAGDGYAALIGGARSVSTDANGSLLHHEGQGTIPHGLIAAYGGDTVKAALAFDKHMDPNIPRIVLVDFENNCVKTSLEAAQALGERLWAVRLDTSVNMKDESVYGLRVPSFQLPGTGNREPGTGVCPELVWNVRKALDEHGFGWVKIIVSGGFNEKRVREFVEQNVPFDGVGVGSALYHERIDFTADIVMTNGKPCAKVGRQYKPNPRLTQD